jgi:hypothetical protein
VDALIVYGSLINKLELTKGGFPLDNTRPLVLRGFKRVFCQEPSWRPDWGEQRAVLNVIGSEQHWLNALLISGLTDGFLADLDKREKGYNRIKVAPSCLLGYHPLSPTPHIAQLLIFEYLLGRGNAMGRGFLRRIPRFDLR